MALKALIFDLDGTLADTDPLHLQVFAELLAPHGYVVDETFFRTRISGGRNQQIFKNLFPGLSDEEADRQSEAKEAMFRDRVRGLRPIAGLLPLLDWAEAKDLRIALVTNAPKSNVDFMVPALGLAGRFDPIVTAADAPIGKPDPAPYRLALARLGIEPSNAIVFEDSTTGIRSSSGAGIFTFGLTTSHKAEELQRAGAGTIIADFTDPVLWQWLEKWL